MSSFEGARRDPRLPGEDLESAGAGAGVLIYDPQNPDAWLTGWGVELDGDDWR